MEGFIKDPETGVVKTEAEMLADLEMGYRRRRTIGQLQEQIARAVPVGYRSFKGMLRGTTSLLALARG